MKKLLLILMLISQFTFGQSVNRQYIGLSIGASFPMNDFKKAVLADSTSGFATTGIAASFDYAYRFTHNFGMQIIFNYSGNGINDGSYQDQLNTKYPEYDFNVESTENWTGGAMLIGPYLRFPLINNLSVDIKALGGYFGSYSPRVLIRTSKIDNINEKDDYYVEMAKGYGFGYMLGAGLKYKVNSYYILLFGNYISSSIEFKDAVGWDWQGEPYSNSFNQKIDYMTITMGVGYIL